MYSVCCIYLIATPLHIPYSHMYSFPCTILRVLTFNSFFIFFRNLL